MIYKKNISIIEVFSLCIPCIAFFVLRMEASNMKHLTHMEHFQFWSSFMFTFSVLMSSSVESLFMMNGWYSVFISILKNILNNEILNLDNEYIETNNVRHPITGKISFYRNDALLAFNRQHHASCFVLQDIYNDTYYRSFI